MTSVDIDVREDIQTPARCLSKSKLMSLQQCPLRLWNEVYRRDEMQKPSAQTQLLFENGNMVGELARKLYAGGQLVQAEYWDREEALRETSRIMSDTSIPAIFEAAFEYRRTHVRCDLLSRAGGTWELWEVKSVRNPQEKHVLDVAIQAFVMSKALQATGYGCELSALGVVHLSADYVYDGVQYDSNGLFKKYSCMLSAYALENIIDGMIDQGLEVIDSSTPPSVAPGDQCRSPYECPFLGTVCQPPAPNELSMIPGIGSARIEKLRRQGITTLADFAEKNQARSAAQKRMIESWKTGKCVTDPALADRLAEIDYPRYYLDFETFAPILPRYPGTSPIQTLPFQFSVHIQQTVDSPARHVGYLHDKDSDPRRPLAETLLEVLEQDAAGPIFMYTGYEKRVLNELATALPDLQERLYAVMARLVDLCAIVKDNVYHPDFKGSFSIKDVLPALVPHLGYDDLEIADGNTASLQYLRMIELAKTDRGAAKVIWDELWKYCKRDTEAMVAVMKRLAELHK